MRRWGIDVPHKTELFSSGGGTDWGDNLRSLKLIFSDPGIPLRALKESGGKGDFVSLYFYL